MKRQCIFEHCLVRKAFVFLMALALLASISGLVSAASDLSGQWVGVVDASSRNGTIELGVSRQGDTWQASVKVELPGMLASNPVTDLKITETELSPPAAPKRPRPGKRRQAA